MDKPRSNLEPYLGDTVIILSETRHSLKDNSLY